MDQTVSVTIKGISPLLMHAFPMTEMEKGWEKWPPDQQAAAAEYRTPDGKLYVPGTAMQRAFINAASYSKGKGRASLQKQVAACVLVSPEYLIIEPQTYAVDSRPVVIAATKGRIMRHRPCFNEWAFTMSVVFDKGLLSEKELRNVIDDAGSRVGILDFRPERKGPFGRFMVTNWK